MEPVVMIDCPLCEKIRNVKIAMQLIDDKTFWRCPQCYCEIWPDEYRLKEIKSELKLKKLNCKLKGRIQHRTHPDPLPPVPIIDPNKRSSSKSGKKSKKKGTKVYREPWELK